MANETNNEGKVEKLQEMMNDENYELNLDALEAATGGSDEKRVDTYGDFL